MQADEIMKALRTQAVWESFTEDELQKMVEEAHMELSHRQDKREERKPLENTNAE